jgi:hypothetical protein
MIEAFKFRAQAILSLLEKKHPPGLHNLSSSIFFHYSTLWVLKESIYNKTLIPRAVFAKLRAISNYFFDTPCIVETKSNPNLQVSLD